MSDTLAHTPLTAWHAEQHAKLVDFAGWEMPIHYSSIVTEHVMTRTTVGLFDVSHMGRFRITGTDALRGLERIATRRIDTLKSGRIRYSLVTNEQGGTLDDVLIYHLLGIDAEPFYYLVVNASNRQKIWNWLQRHWQGWDIQLQDQTLQTAMIAVQGPRALSIAGPLLAQASLAEMPYFSGQVVERGGAPLIVSRTGYTGEDGVELIAPAGQAASLWRQLHAAAVAQGGGAVGLGARDTLRLEAALPLYGHELSEEITPIQAGLDFAVDLEGRGFLGHDALAQAAADPQLPRRIGLRLEGKRVPRQHYTVLGNGEAVGEITSGTFSPTLQCPLAMGYVRQEYARPGTVVQVDLRGRAIDATIVKLPFYRRTP